MSSGQAIDVFTSYYTRRSTPELRKQEIVEYLHTKGRATRKEITAVVKCAGAFDYLHDLEAEGIVSHESVRNVHHYFLA